MALALWSPWSDGGRNYGFLTKRQVQTLRSDIRRFAGGPPRSEVSDARVYRTTLNRYERVTGDHPCCLPRHLFVLVLHGDLVYCHSAPDGVSPCDRADDAYTVYRPRPLVALKGGIGFRTVNWRIGPSVNLDVG